MKTSIVTQLVVLIGASFLLGCQDDFLEEPKETSAVSPDVVFTSLEGTQALMAGILRRSRTQFSSTDTGGLYSIFYARTVKGNDIIQRASWYGFDYDNDNREPGYRRTTFNWEFPFFMINQVNIYIKGVQESESFSEEEQNNLLAQGFALRGYYYFQLAMEYQHTYSYDTSLEAPPIYKEPTTEGKGMSTLGEMYSFIIEDLELAKSMASEHRIDKSWVNIDVVNAILSQVYLVKGDWSKAESTAAAARLNYPLNASEYSNGFNDMNADEWIWAMPQSDDQSNFYYGAPHSQADHYQTSYKATYFNVDFVNLFTNTDVRNLFENLYGVPDNDYRARITKKFNFIFSTDLPIYRSPELLLTEAEAKARQGDDSGAASLLFELQSNRDPNAIASGNIGNDLIDEILLEKRKELYAEKGIEWFDAKRLRKGIPRTGNHRLINSDLQVDDLKFFLKIPQDEIDANEFIDDSVNDNR